MTSTIASRLLPVSLLCLFLFAGGVRGGEANDNDGKTYNGKAHGALMRPPSDIPLLTDMDFPHTATIQWAKPPQDFVVSFEDPPATPDNASPAPGPAPLAPDETPLSFADALLRGLQCHPDLLIARHIPEIARAGVDAARAVYDPEAFAEWTRSEDNDARENNGVGFSRQSITHSERAGLRQHLPTGGAVTAYREWIDGNERGGAYRRDYVGGAANVVELRQPLLHNLGDRENRTRIRVARIQTHISDEEFRQAVSDAVAGVGEAYWQFVGAREEIRIAAEVLAKAEEVLGREKTRRGEGLLTELDAQRAVEAVEARRADCLRAEEQFLIARERMGFLLGIDLDSREKLAPTEPVTTPAFTVDVQEAISEARRNRPEIKAAEQRISEGEQRRRLARHSRLPRLDAIAGVRDNQPRRTGAVGGDSRDLTGTDWNVGVEFSMPLGQMGARAAMRQAEAELAQRRAELRRAQEQAVTEARMAAKQIDVSRREIPTAARAVEAARKVIEGEAARWELSRVGNQDLLRAHDLLAAAERNHLQAQLRYNIALIQYFHARGTLLERVGVQVAPPAAKSQYSDLWKR